MPRKAPDNVQEMRVTFGTYERQFVKEIKTDIETGAKIAAVGSVLVPVVLGVSVFAGLAGLGYGIYRGLDSFGFGAQTETLGCILRKYARVAIPFGDIIFADCDLTSDDDNLDGEGGSINDMGGYDYPGNTEQANLANEEKRRRYAEEHGLPYP